MPPPPYTTPGKWRLIYTTAIDVLPVLALEQRLPLFPFGSPIQVGDIYQSFSSMEGEEGGSSGSGLVQNIIQLGVPGTVRREGLTFRVLARCAVVAVAVAVLQVVTPSVVQMYMYTTWPDVRGPCKVRCDGSSKGAL